MSYTTPPQFSGTPPNPPRQEIDFSVIGEGFNMLFANWKAYVIPGLIIMIVNIPSFIVSFWPLIATMMGNEPSTEAQVGSALLQLVLSLGAALVSIFLYPGIVQYTLKVVRREPVSTDDLWFGFRDPLGMFAVQFIAGLVTMVGVIGCCIGVMFTGGLMMFALPHKVATGQTASESVSLSWNMLKSSWLMAGLFYFVVIILSVIGEIACYVGLVLTMPLMYILPTLVYCQFMGISGSAQPQQSPHSPYPR